MSQVAALADRLREAEERRAPIAALTDELAALAVHDAYRIQRAGIEKRLARGARVVGWKAGITSQAMQRLLGVGEPDFGHLLDDMMVPDASTISRSRLIRPKVEPEIAFVMSRRVAGPGVTPADVLEATAAIVPVLEVIDSRIRDWRIRLADTIADNASCGMVVVGNRRTWDGALDLARVRGVLEINGRAVAEGLGEAVLGHPANAVSWLANKLGDMGQALGPGDIVLPGSVCAAFDVHAGDLVTARFEQLGTVSVTFG